MKNLIAFALALLLACACDGGKTQEAVVEKDTTVIEIEDTTIYGRCVEAANFSVFIATANGDTLEFVIPEDTLDFDPIRIGGLYTGDNLAILSHKSIDGERIADKVINLTTLMGKWRETATGDSLVLDEDFKWIKNGNIVVGKKQMSIYELGPDTLVVEADSLMWIYCRQRSEK